jgi:hypothetical protein
MWVGLSELLCPPCNPVQVTWVVALTCLRSILCLARAEGDDVCRLYASAMEEGCGLVSRLVALACSHLSPAHPGEYRWQGSACA